MSAELTGQLLFTDMEFEVRTAAVTRENTSFPCMKYLSRFGRTRIDSTQVQRSVGVSRFFIHAMIEGGKSGFPERSQSSQVRQAHPLPWCCRPPSMESTHSAVYVSGGACEGGGGGGAVGD